MDQFIFWIAASVAVIAAIRVVLVRNAIVSVLHLIVTLVALAVLFLQLSAEFVAALQIIIYGGAIMVLFLFVIMMLNLRRDEFGSDPIPSARFLGALAAGALLAEMFVIFSGERAMAARLGSDFGGVRSVGLELFGDYIFPFELTSVLLLAAVLVAAVMARRPEEDDPTPAPIESERGEA